MICELRSSTLPTSDSPPSPPGWGWKKRRGYAWQGGRRRTCTYTCMSGCESESESEDGSQESTEMCFSDEDGIHGAG